jgi:Fur family ferric uptake transcriptional regulator
MTQAVPTRLDSGVDEDRRAPRHRLNRLICRDCGRIDAVDGRPGACPSPDRAGGFVIEEAEATFWGRCPGCADTSGTTDTADKGRARHP